MKVSELKEILSEFNSKVKEVTMPLGQDPFVLLERTYRLHTAKFFSVDSIIAEFSGKSMVAKDCDDEFNQSGDVSQYVIHYWVSEPIIPQSLQRQKNIPQGVFSDEEKDLT